MANKIYNVVKDGEVLKELKTLAAAKKLADAEGAEVYCEGESVYKGAVATSAGTAVEAVDTAETENTEKTEAVETDTYRLKHRMNVRKAPAKDAEILGTKPVGAFVDVVSLKDDWLHLTDGSFILFGGGKFAEKIS